MSEATLKRQLRDLRDELLEAQFRLRRDPKFALAVIVAGAPTAGRSEIVNELIESLDPKYVSVHAFHEPDREDSRRPPMYRYWSTLPARGRITFYFAAWYQDALSAALGKKARNGDARIVERIRQLEAMLAADHVRLVKLFLTTDAKTQRKRLAKLRADKLTRWRVTREDVWLAKHHKQASRAAARVIRATDRPAARWRVIDGADADRRLIRAAREICAELRRAFAARASCPSARSGRIARTKRELPTEPEARVSDDAYEAELEALQSRLARLTRSGGFRKRALVLAFEGIDAAGKGGAIRRLTHALDARQYRVVPVSAPTAEEALHPYLWRFWRCVPEAGAVAIYDRSWYGRVLVERVRSFTTEADWRRAYDEIREFERQLAEHGIIVAKFWLNVSKAGQLERFKARNDDPLKRFKVDEEDWTNRRFYADYQRAAIDMIERTHADYARWTVVPADHKPTARLMVLRTVCETIERALS